MRVLVLSEIRGQCSSLRCLAVVVRWCGLTTSPRWYRIADRWCFVAGGAAIPLPRLIYLEGTTTR
jgi:hypothetical protein